MEHQRVAWGRPRCQPLPFLSHPCFDTLGIPQQMDVLGAKIKLTDQKIPQGLRIIHTATKRLFRIGINATKKCFAYHDMGLQGTTLS